MNTMNRITNALAVAVLLMAIAVCGYMHNYQATIAFALALVLFIHNIILFRSKQRVSVDITIDRNGLKLGVNPSVKSCFIVELDGRPHIGMNGMEQEDVIRLMESITAAEELEKDEQ